jgi:hypothetical protein
MRCFNHQDKEAIGVCKSCARGLCPSCAAEVEKAIACRGRCEVDVSTLLSLNRNSLQFAKTSKQARYLAPTLLIVLGMMLGLMGITHDGIDFTAWAGGIMMVIGIAFMIIHHRMVHGLKT